MKSFRLPRKIKKSLKGHFWLYPADKDGNSVMAWPRTSQEDYTAIKRGIVKDRFKSRKTKERKEYWAKMDEPIIVSDEILSRAVNDIFAEKYRKWAFHTLSKAKNNPKAIIA